MAEDKALSSGSIDDAPTITVVELGMLSGHVAVPSTSTEALNELKLQGFTVEQEREGVKLLAPPREGAAWYPVPKHDLNEKRRIEFNYATGRWRIHNLTTPGPTIPGLDATRPQPGAIYPTGEPVGEYMQLPEVSRKNETQSIAYRVREKQQSFLAFLPFCKLQQTWVCSKCF